MINAILVNNDFSEEIQRFLGRTEIGADILQFWQNKRRKNLLMRYSHMCDEHNMFVNFLQDVHKRRRSVDLRLEYPKSYLEHLALFIVGKDEIPEHEHLAKLWLDQLREFMADSLNPFREDGEDMEIMIDCF